MNQNQHTYHQLCLYRINTHLNIYRQFSNGIQFVQATRFDVENEREREEVIFRAQDPIIMIILTMMVNQLYQTLAFTHFVSKNSNG